MLAGTYKVSLHRTEEICLPLLHREADPVRELNSPAPKLYDCTIAKNGVKSLRDVQST